MAHSNEESNKRKFDGKKKSFISGFLHGLGHLTSREVLPCIVEKLHKLYENWVNSIDFA